MTCIRERLEHGNPDYAKIAIDFLRTGIVHCYITSEKRKGLTCGYIKEPLPYAKFFSACKRCRQELRDRLLREENFVIGIFGEEAPKVLLQLKQQRDL